MNDLPTMQRSLDGEAKISAAIVCSLPLAVSAILGVVNPDYIGLLFRSYEGRMMLGFAVFAMVAAGLLMTRMGSPIKGESLEQLRQRADSLGPRMTLPMIFLVLPSMFTIIVGPTIVMKMDPSMKLPGRAAVSETVRHTASAPTDRGSCIAFGAADRDGSVSEITMIGYARVVEACKDAFPR